MTERRKVVFATPCLSRPTQPYLAALEGCLPTVEAAGWDHLAVFETCNPYISGARAKLLRKALDAKPDAVVFLDYDLSWGPEDMVALLDAEGEVVAGTYRFKTPEEEYMGGWETDDRLRPIVRDDGCIQANRVPAGFLKITPIAVDAFMRAYPELVYGPRYHPCVDLFNHGAIDGVWYGEDYAFSKRWIESGGDLWLIPDLDITHHSADAAFPGNLHRFMLRQPGGSEA